MADEFRPQDYLYTYLSRNGQYRYYGVVSRATCVEDVIAKARALKGEGKRGVKVVQVCKVETVVWEGDQQ